MAIRDYRVQLNANGEGVINVNGNFIQLIEVSAPLERYRVIAIDKNGNEVVNIQMLNGGRIKNLDKSFNEIRIVNLAQGNGAISLVAGTGDYEEGAITAETSEQTDLRGGLIFESTSEDEMHVIPADDSRKWLTIQADDENGSYLLINSAIQLFAGEVWERPIKSAVYVQVKMTGDKVNYIGER